MMSGGFFNFKNYELDMIADSIQHIIDNNTNEELNEWGDKCGRFYSQETIDYMVITVKMLKTAAILTHRIDYLLECDDSEETFLKRIKEEIDQL